MDVVSDGSLPVASLLWQARASTWVLTVVCKATFTLAPAESPLAPAQEPIRERDAYRDDDPARSLIEASDLAPLKQGADVVLVGHAHAPGGKPARSLVARMVVGEIDKAIQASCDRLFTQEGELQEGARFTKMPLDYERAAGGPDTENPSGIDREARDDRGRTTVPNLLPVDQVVSSPDDSIAAVGFGPIAPAWPLRHRRLGKHAAAWSSGALLSNLLPEDFDRSFFNVAPLDQRLQELCADERILLENLHPLHPRLVTSLPGVRPRATITGRAGGPRDLVMRCDTLVIDTDRLLCTVTWRGQLPLASPKEAGQVRVELERPAKQAPAEAATPSAPRLQPPPLVAPPAPKVKPPSPGASTLTMDAPAPLPDAPQAPVMPFRAGPPTPPPPPEPPPPRPSEPPGFRPKMSSIRKETRELTETVSKVPLPFVASPAALSPSDALNTAPPISAPPIANASPGEPVSPWAAAAPQPASSDAGVTPQAPAAPRTIGAMLAGTSAAAAPAAAADASAASAAAAAAQGDALALVWFDRRSVPRILRKPAWQRLLDAMEAEPLDPEADDPALSDEPAEIEDRAQVFEILYRAAAADAEGVHAALARAAGKRGTPVPPLELVEGELSLSFDEVETLKALLSTATPLAAGDEALATALGAAEKFLGTPGVSSAPAVAEALCGRIREALAHGKKGRAELANEQVGRALLEQRHYQKRRVLGGPHLRALLHVKGEKQPLVIYLPASIAEDLPLSARFRARLIAAVHPAIDERETEPAALQAAALGRVVQVRQRRAS
ncbi:DUF2169 family type VI secretion system accessory protein [Sorangium sp. So ce388]|uniref:DUF2169 family type VI secretion system accessory protein n=1 Tax=Sorangium sp. So ce388 TaxID=3133309 RepID=UPI003F5B0800